ncbi:hypothetical protein [Kitasatospora sp. NPDC093102]|uniref:terpene synthase family protein n=1 Tax=Kitasatospora sp. NPDC093102 TaxID=3155069 RepID=UPI0034206EEB
MARRYPIDVPFAERFNPGITRATSRHLAWLDRFGLLPERGALKRYLTWRYPECVARWWPSAVGPELDLGFDALGWMVILDGQFDRDRGLDPARTSAAVDSLLAVLDGRPAHRSPAAASFADLWERQCEGMSDYYRARAAGNWANIFRAFETETLNRAAGAVPDEEEYRRLRDVSGYMYALLDLNERLRRCELSRAVWESGTFQQLVLATVWAINYMQDVLSHEREERQGDGHNIVFVLEHHRGLSREEALEEAITMVHDHMRVFLGAEAAIPFTLDSLGVPLADRPAVYGCIDDMRASISATYVWCSDSPRYAVSGDSRDDQQGYLGDICDEEHLLRRTG